MALKVEEHDNGSLKCVKWKTELKNESGISDANFRLTRFNSIYHYRVLCTYDRIVANPKTLDLNQEFLFGIELCLEQIKINDDESTSRKVANENFLDYHHALCDVWVTANKSEKFFLKKMTKNASDYWKSEVFGVGISTAFKSITTGCTPTFPLVDFEIWIKFHSFGESEAKALQNVANYLFVEQNNCDVKFCFEDDQQIGAHKKILSARSPVFAAMFKHDMLETQTGKVIIKDIDMEIFKELLHFIYYGRISEPVNEVKARPLLLAADRYGILDLKEDCSRKLISSIRLTNAICLLIWAHTNSVDQVKEAALDAVVRNGKKICFQDEWETLTLLHPDLCLLATRRMMN